MQKLTKLFVVLSIFFSVFSNAQDKIGIDTEIIKIDEGLYDVTFTFEIEEGWHLYSQFNPENASVPLKISVGDENENVMLVGKAIESETQTKYSEQWKCDEIFFEETAELVQRVQILDFDTSKIVLNLVGQICEENCLPINEDFTFELDENGDPVNGVVAENESESNEELGGTENVMSSNLKLDLKNKKILSAHLEHTKINASLISIFFLGLLGGLLAFFTPCVFPLVPLTVSFFTKQSGSKSKGVFNAVMYGVFILLIYILLSLPFHFIDSLDPQILNTISTQVWLNVFFFVVLVFFAGSFFGFYEITLPSSWGNKMDSASGIGGIIGIFFMALTLAIVSFSCTGPILGSLLAGSLKGGAWPLTAGMAGFGFALAFPFGLFAMFPSLLSTLPKSGGWMTTIKIVLGFIEVLLAFKFLSVADLVGKWNLFYREVFIVIWLIIILLFILFLFGFIRFSGNKKVKRLAGIRILFGLVAVGAFIYLAPGVMKNPKWKQTLLSGLAPPEFHSIYEKGTECPLHLNCFKDFEQGMAYAKQVNKPVLLDFTGWGCINCRNMEEKVWTQPAIYEMLEEVVLISLYVDDYNNKLPKDQQFDYVRENGKKKRITTYGGKWSTMQIENFHTTSQPYYVLMTPDLYILNRGEQNCSSSVFEEWLKTGLDNFEKGSAEIGEDESADEDDDEDESADSDEDEDDEESIDEDDEDDEIADSDEDDEDEDDESYDEDDEEDEDDGDSDEDDDEEDNEEDEGDYEE